jgi:anti-sigma factor RsiW
MSADELQKLLPDLVDGALIPQQRQEATAALADHPAIRREYEIALRVREFVTSLQADPAYRAVLPPDFEQKLLMRVQQQGGNLELLDLSSRFFGFWLIEFINLIGGLLNPTARTQQNPV